MNEHTPRRAATHAVAFFAPNDDNRELFAVYTNGGDAYRLSDVRDDAGRSVPSLELCALCGAESEADALAIAHDLTAHGARVDVDATAAVWS